jgi:hypothetical protein
MLYILSFLVALFVLLSSSLFFMFCVFVFVFYFYSCDLIILCLDVAIRKVQSTFLAAA